MGTVPIVTFTNAYIDRKYFVDKNGAWDGVTIKDTDAFDPGDTDTITPVKDGETSLTILGKKSPT